jgi:hypothetical protein
MTGLAALWAPILIATVVVFLASSVIHMAPLWHRGELPAVPNEEKVSDALRPFAIPPGDYMLPRAANMEAMKSSAFTERVLLGPNMILTVLPNTPWSMGRNLVLWFLYCLVVSIFTAVVAGCAFPTDAPYGSLLRVAGVTSFLGYTAALWQMSIWYRRSWKTSIKATIDGIIYAAITAVAFGWHWPR